MSLQYNLLAIPLPQKSAPNSRLEKFAPVDLTSWSATGRKNGQVNNVRGQRWILWYWCSGKCIIKGYKCTYMHSQPLKCWRSLNLEYPGTFCLNCHVECFLTRTGWIVRVVIKWMPAETHSNKQVASWLDLMISHTNRCLPGIFQGVTPFGVLVSVIDELYTLFQLILLCSHLSKEWGSNGIFQPCLFWTHYSPCKNYFDFDKKTNYSRHRWYSWFMFEILHSTPDFQNHFIF